MRRAVWVLGWATIVASAGACEGTDFLLASAGAGGTDAVQDGGLASDAGPDATSGGSDGLDAGAPPDGDYRVTIEASRERICAGECVALTAEAEAGRAPYRYAWSGELGDGAGPHEACPSRTTTYEVTATDTALLGDEFGQPSRQASASIEITVDGGEACEPQPDGGAPPPRDTSVVCSARVPYEGQNRIYAIDTWSGNASIATDDERNVYFVAIFEGTLGVGEQTITASGGPASVLLKYDARCELVWAKVLAPGESGLLLMAVAEGGGELALGGVLNGAVDLGDGPLSAGLFPIALLAKLSSTDGSVRWSAGFGSVLQGAAIYDLGIDAQGDVVISGIAGTSTDFGSGAIGGMRPETSYVAKVYDDGATSGYGFAIDDTDNPQPIALHAVSGQVVTVGHAQTGTIWVAGQPYALSDDAARWYVALFDLHGQLGWLHTVQPDAIETPAGWVGAFAVDRELSTVLARPVLMSDALGNPRMVGEIMKVGSDGSLRWSHPVAASRARDYLHGTSMATDPDDNIVHGYWLSGEAAALPFPGPVVAGAEEGVNVEKLTPDGDPIWHHTFGPSAQQRLWGVTADPDGGVWVAHDEVGALVLTKLAP